MTNRIIHIAYRIAIADTALMGVARHRHSEVGCIIMDN